MTTTRRSFSRPQKTTIVYGILSIVVVVTILQLWLITATMNAFLGGRSSVIIPAGIASTICFAFNAGLLWYVYAIDRK
jgi:hypothetical protein